MKKILLIPALMASIAMADQKKYEISPMIGYNMVEGNIGIKGDEHFLGGLEVQFNSEDSKISPELSVMYSPKAKYDGINPNPKDTHIIRAALNGVYTLDAMGALTPFVKAGIGAEKISKPVASNQSGFFLDAGAGVKFAFTENVALKAEALYLGKPVTTHNKNFDNNLVAMAGLTFAFGDMEQKPAPVVTAAPAVVDGDDDNDGVKNSVDQCPTTDEGVTVDANGCALDSDNDGVIDDNDNCQNTEVGTAVDENGCDLDSDEDGVIDDNDNCPNTELGTAVDENGCDLDSDQDGVVDADDLCPNTPAGAEVNSDGCLKEATLAINFENNSAAITQDSDAQLNEFADFLTTYKNYSAKIIGYTDSIGSAEYNQKLSEKRAQAVVDALITRGVDASQLSAEGMGEADPIADNATAQGRAQNRRIEAQLTKN